MERIAHRVAAAMYSRFLLVLQFPEVCQDLGPIPVPVFLYTAIASLK